MNEEIDFFLVKSLFGFDVIKTPDKNPENGEKIGALINLGPLLGYIHYLSDYVPTCVRDSGHTFKVPVAEFIHVLNNDR